MKTPSNAVVLHVLLSRRREALCQRIQEQLESLTKLIRAFQHTCRQLQGLDIDKP